jgi:hypothetical protein
MIAFVMLIVFSSGEINLAYKAFDTPEVCLEEATKASAIASRDPSVAGAMTTCEELHGRPIDEVATRLLEEWLQ